MNGQAARPIHPRTALVVCGALALALALATGVSAVGTTPRLTVVARNLDNPRKLFAAPDGAVYVVEAGTGGTDKCLPPLSMPTCVGMTGSITRISHGKQSRVLVGLLSFADTTRRRAQGPADVVVRNGRYYVLLQDLEIDKRGGNELGPDGKDAGSLVTSGAGKARPKLVANLAAYEAAHNPDHGAGRGAKYGDPSLDSDPYAFVPYRRGYAVADAAANDLLWIDPHGKVSLLAVFPARTEHLTPRIAREIGLPGAKKISVQSVPSSVVVGPDGALYVGELTGIPFTPGTARVWRVEPGAKPRLYATGFTNISDLAFTGGNLLVLELASKGLLDASSPGALIRVGRKGSRKVIASAGLVAPTGLAVSDGAIYISNYGLFPGSGPGPHGEVVRLGS